VLTLCDSVVKKLIIRIIYRVAGYERGLKLKNIMRKILIIEDEQDMVEGLKFNLEARDYTVIAAYDGETGNRKALEEKPDLVILDLMLPKLNGYEVCKILKKEIPELPIIMLTAKSQEAEIVTGLELGADDYITKPFSVLELIARINALFRRMAAGVRPQEEYKYGDLEINFKKYIALLKGRSLKLSPREYEILRLFIERQGEIITREELLKKIWGYDSFPDTRTVDAHIAKLRRKIEDRPEEPKLIVTVHGLGYKFL
jgi:DNA-binding response OmpR family regulator